MLSERRHLKEIQEQIKQLEVSNDNLQDLRQFLEQELEERTLKNDETREREGDLKNRLSRREQEEAFLQKNVKGIEEE